jgi:hypothetical protein
VISRTFSRHGDTLGFSEEHTLLQPDCLKLCTYIAHAFQSTCFYLKLYARRQGACHRIQTDTRLCAAVVFSWQTSSLTIRGYSGLFKSVLRIWIRIRMYWASWIRIRIRNLLSLSKNSEKNLDSYCFVTSFWLFIFENYVLYLQKVISRKTFFKLVFCWHLEGQWRK